MIDNSLVMKKCMDILCKTVGIVEAERFIYLIKTESFDYTQWQREYYDAIPEDVLKNDIEKFCSENPFNGKKAIHI